jgi:hypothetical protein
LNDEDEAVFFVVVQFVGKDDMFAFCPVCLFVCLSCPVSLYGQFFLCAFCSISITQRQLRHSAKMRKGRGKEKERND